MLKDLCKVRRMGVAAAAAVSIAGSVLLIYNLVTPHSVQMMRTADLVALVAMLLLPVLTLATMRRAARSRWPARAPGAARHAAQSPRPGHDVSHRRARRAPAETLADSR